MKKQGFGIFRKPYILVFILALVFIMSFLLTGCAKTNRHEEPSAPPASELPSDDDDETDDDKPTPKPDDGDDKPTPEPDDGDDKPTPEPDDGDDKPTPEPDGGDDKPTHKPDDGDDEPTTEWDVSASPVTAALIADGDNYVLKIDGSGEMKSWTKAEDVPWHGFAAKIKAVTIGEHVTGIGDHAFSDIVATDIIIPESVKSVGKYALPSRVDAYVYGTTRIAPEQRDGITFNIYSEGVPQTHDRHWTSWGSNGSNITDAPFVEEKPYWHYDGGRPVLWEKKKVLFIGNSFTFYYQIPAQFDAIAEDLGYYVETYSITVPGQTLESHADSASVSGVQIDALLEKIDDFDYVVLQEQSTRPYTDYDKFFNAVKALKKKIADTQSSAQVYLYQTWGSPASAGDSYEQIVEMEEKLYEACTQAAIDTDSKVSYVGRAFTLIKGETDLDLYFGDKRHPGPVGAYLSACVHAATLLGADVRKTSLTGADLSVIPNEGGVAQPMNLSQAQCETLRAAAYRTVFESDTEQQTYTVEFWYNGELQDSKTVSAGFGFTLPSCTVASGEKFSGWTLEGDDTFYAANTRLGYSAVVGSIVGGTVKLYAKTHEMIIAVWGRWITEANFKLVMDGFETYCEQNGLDYGKVGYIYYAGKTQNVDPYFLIADFTAQVTKDGADIVFPCGDNIKSAQSAIASMVTEFKELGVGVEGNTTRYVAKLNGNTLTDAFYTFITTDAAKEILGGLS